MALELNDSIFEEKVLYEEQNHEKATYAKKILKSEGEIKWSENAENILGKMVTNELQTNIDRFKDLVEKNYRKKFSN